MGLDECFETLVGGFAFGEVELANGFLDPDVDWESVLEAVGEKQNAVGDFFADAGEFAEAFAGLWRWEGADGFEVEFVGGDDARGFEEVRSAESHLAGAELGFGEGGEFCGGWEAEGCVCWARAWQQVVPITL